MEAVVAQHFPGLALVGYESGSHLAAALAAGFTELGRLRIRVRS